MLLLILKHDFVLKLGLGFFHLQKGERRPYVWINIMRVALMRDFQLCIDLLGHCVMHCNEEKNIYC